MQCAWIENMIDTVYVYRYGYMQYSYEIEIMNDVIRQKSRQGYIIYTGNNLHNLILEQGI